MKKLLAALLLLTSCAMFQVRPENIDQLTDGYCVVMAELGTTYANVANIAPYCINLNVDKWDRLADEVQFAIIAHEVSHVNDFRMGVPTSERRADWFAGCMLGTASMDLSPVVYWFANETYSDADHPPIRERIYDLVNGHRFCTEGIK